MAQINKTYDLWVCNIPGDMTSNEFVDMFKAYGEIAYYTIRNHLRTACFKYKRKEDADKAQAELHRSWQDQNGYIMYVSFKETFFIRNLIKSIEKLDWEKCLEIIEEYNLIDFCLDYGSNGLYFTLAQYLEIIGANNKQLYVWIKELIKLVRKEKLGENCKHKSYNIKFGNSFELLVDRINGYEAKHLFIKSILLEHLNIETDVIKYILFSYL
jgi:hypothetical protein